MTYDNDGPVRETVSADTSEELGGLSVEGETVESSRRGVLRKSRQSAFDRSGQGRSETHEIGRRSRPGGSQKSGVDDRRKDGNSGVGDGDNERL